MSKKQPTSRPSLNTYTLTFMTFPEPEKQTGKSTIKDEEDSTPVLHLRADPGWIAGNKAFRVEQPTLRQQANYSQENAADRPHF